MVCLLYLQHVSKYSESHLLVTHKYLLQLYCETLKKAIADDNPDLIRNADITNEEALKSLEPWINRPEAKINLKDSVTGKIISKQEVSERAQRIHDALSGKEKPKAKKKAPVKLTARGIATEVTKLSEKTRNTIIELMREREYVGLDYPERENDITQLLSGEFGGDFEQEDATKEELAVHEELSKVFPNKELRERVLKYIDDNIPNKVWTADFLEGMARDRLLKYIGPEAVAEEKRHKFKAKKKAKPKKRGK